MGISRKLFKALAVVLVLSFLPLPATASAPDAADQSVRQATLPPALDGNLSDWDGVPAMALDLDTRAPNSSGGVERSDAMYSLRLLQTADALYLGLNARDEKLMADSGADLHKDDSLRFSVDGNKDGAGGAASDHAYRIRIDGKVNDAGGPELTGKAVTPLLIEEAKAVPNDALFAAGTCIITGSNMSGKTTYMRTLATSAILAYAGAPVCAEHFALTPMAVYTSIHVSDDLSRGISTFYAEILRIRQMVEASQEERPLLLCIDEIFKGTNSADRITGAAEAIKRLTRPSCITLVTTHDFELCDLQSPNDLPIKNFHFEESYPDDKIHFDFKIRPGRCHTTNARYLLKMAGILS